MTEVQLNPLQLVLVGTALEGTVFLFEIPTGVLADTVSRRLSVIVGTFLPGLGPALEAIAPAFAAVLAGEVVRGFGIPFSVLLAGAGLRAPLYPHLCHHAGFS